VEIFNKQLIESFEKVKKSLVYNLTKIRTGRANVAVLDAIHVDYYGNPTPLKQVAQISIPEARILQIHPFDKTLIPLIEKAIYAANIGITPNNDGMFIRLSFPMLTEEKRKLLVKDIKKFSEESKVALRNTRRDIMNEIKKLEKEKAFSEDESKKIQDNLQDTVDRLTKDLDVIAINKEKEIMTI
jgi:ribosome recycling factor